MKPKLAAYVFLISAYGAIYQVHAQARLAKHYVNPTGDSTYLRFYDDSTFYYRYSYDLMQNRDRGKYHLKKDTILLQYEPFRSLSESLEARGFRPDTLLVRNNKLYLVREGKAFDKADRTPLTFKPPHAWPYRRRYFLFGSYVPKPRHIYYMIDKQYATHRR